MQALLCKVISYKELLKEVEMYQAIVEDEVVRTIVSYIGKRGKVRVDKIVFPEESKIKEVYERNGLDPDQIIKLLMKMEDKGILSSRFEDNVRTFYLSKKAKSLISSYEVDI